MSRITTNSEFRERWEMVKKVDELRGVLIMAFLLLVGVTAGLFVGTLASQNKTRTDMNQRVCTVYVEQKWPLPDYCDQDDLSNEALDNLLRRK